VSRLDDRLKESLPTLASGILPDADDLAVVRRRAMVARRRAVRRAVWAVVAVAGLIAVVVLGLSFSDRLRGVEPVGPAPSPSPSSNGLREIANPFTVLRSINAAAVGIDRPLRLAVAPDGHVYVTDHGQRVTELTASGAVVRQWGGPGTAPGKFRMYSGALTVGADGDVYVADTGNFRIQVFTSSGRFVAQYGGYGQGAGKFVWPSDIVVGKDGTMYVADDRAATITALSPTGHQLWRRGTPGAETDPNLVGHEHLGGVDAAGELVTANDDKGRVLFVDPAGNVLDTFSTNQAGAGVDASGIPTGHFPYGTCGATLDPHGDVYVNSCEESYQARHDTAVYDPQHRLIAGWKRGSLADSPEFAPDGHAWAVKAGNRTLVELQVHLTGS
jgi:streptogramin lyase